MHGREMRLRRLQEELTVAPFFDCERKGKKGGYVVVPAGRQQLLSKKALRGERGNEMNLNRKAPWVRGFSAWRLLNGEMVVPTGIEPVSPA